MISFLNERLSAENRTKRFMKFEKQLNRGSKSEMESVKGWWLEALMRKKKGGKCVYCFDSLDN